MKFILAGYGEHGKDEVAERMAAQFGLVCTGSSKEANRRFIFKALAPIMGYACEEECYEDRRNLRTLWYELIRGYNRQDKGRLARDIFENADVYVGIRDQEELKAIRAAGLADVVIWVDASDRKPAEEAQSCAVGPEDADYILDNNGPKDALDGAIDRMWRWMALASGQDLA